MTSGFASLITVVSSLVSALTLNRSSSLNSKVPELAMPMAGTGAIPKRLVVHQPCSFDAMMPVDLATLREDPNAVSQANQMADALDVGPAGNSASVSPSKTLKHGWAWPGGESAPHIPVPWLQDFVIGQGHKPRLLYDELDVLQWVQSCLSMAEREPDLQTVRAMLAQFRLTLRDAQSYGFEAARFAFGSVLSLMEDGTLV
jgi:hypothetical protein